MITNEERERMVELVLGNRYIALGTIPRLLRPEVFVDASGPCSTRARREAAADFGAEVRRALDELCSASNARVGKLDREDARNFCLRGNVYYSTEWMACQMESGASRTPAEQVGLTLYEELQGISEQLYKITGSPEQALAYPSVAILARMGARNHQDIVDVGEFSRFLGIFMRRAAPYAFRRLKVSVVSFSYPRGVPEDDDDDYWGGFVFDCRSMPDPHDDKSLRGYSGLDKPVIDFFGRHKEQVDRFLDAAESLVRQSVEAFLKTGRDFLQVAFGCYGGRHRSVYLAERFAERLAGTEGVEVEVKHTARQFWL